MKHSKPLKFFLLLSSPTKWTLFSSNVQSLNAKFDNLLILLDELNVNFSILALQEVWSLGKDYLIDGYHPPVAATRDEKLQVKNPKCGGGVLFFINSSLDFERLTFPSMFTKNIYESVWIKVKFGTKSIIVGNIYRPPGYSKSKINSAMEIHYAIINLIKTDPRYKYCPLYLVGDLNLDLLKNEDNSDIGAYLDSMFSFGLLPCITKPTRFQEPDTRISGSTCPLSKTPTLIDHIFSSSKTAKICWYTFKWT